MIQEKRANYIKSEMALAGLTQAKAAEELGIKPQSICYWISGRFSSKRIGDYFGEKFGSAFLEQIEIH